MQICAWVSQKNLSYVIDYYPLLLSLSLCFCLRCCSCVEKFSTFILFFSTNSFQKYRGTPATCSVIFYYKTCTHFMSCAFQQLMHKQHFQRNAKMEQVQSWLAIRPWIVRSFLEYEKIHSNNVTKRVGYGIVFYVLLRSESPVLFAL